MRRGGALALSILVACNTAPKASPARDAPSAAASGATPVALAPSAGPVATGAPAPDGGVRVVAASEDTDAPSLIRTARLQAKAEGRLLVVYAGASWCEPCRRFKQEVHAGRLDARLGKITLLAFDADRDAERLASAGYRFQYIPFVALPGPDGKPVDSEQATGKGGGAYLVLVSKLEAWQSAAGLP